MALGRKADDPERLREWHLKARFFGQAALRLLLFQDRVADEQLRRHLLRHVQRDARTAAHLALLYLEHGGEPEKLSKTRRLKLRRQLVAEVATVGLIRIRVSVPKKRALPEPPKPRPPLPLGEGPLDGIAMLFAGARHLARLRDDVPQPA